MLRYLTLPSFIFSFMLLIGLSGNACINEYRTRIDGGVHQTMPHSGIVYTRSFDTLAIKKAADELWQSYLTSGSAEYLSDYAAQLIYLGDYDRAKTLYFQVESLIPGRYTTASNLGTIYELIGMPDSALYWIERSVEINPQSHKGTEWIHIKILEHQISKESALEKSILNLDFGDDIFPENLAHQNLQKMHDDIRYQLQERLRFVSPKNEIVGNIYFDLGNINALQYDLESALESYYEAGKFGYTTPLMLERIAKFELMSNRSKFVGRIWHFVKTNMGLTLLLIFLTPIVLLIIRRVFFRKRKRAKS